MEWVQEGRVGMLLTKKGEKGLKNMSMMTGTWGGSDGIQSEKTRGRGGESFDVFL